MVQWAILLFGLNAAVAIVSSVFAAREARAPGSLEHAELSDAGRFYSRLYSIRGIPLGLAAAIAPFLILCDAGAGAAAATLVLVAFVVQASDFVLLARRVGLRNIRPLSILFAAVVHLATVIVLFCGGAPAG